jgi:hypothetical protein
VLQNQGNLCVESLQGIVDAVDKGCVDGGEIGKKTVLPASHTGGRRYMIQNYHDGIAICRVHGPPDFLLRSCVTQSGKRFLKRCPLNLARNRQIELT